MTKKKTKKPIIHEKASKKIVALFKAVKRETGQWNIRETARRLNINQKYIQQNLIHGIEPTNIEIRKKMFLKVGNCPMCGRKIIEKKEVLTMLKKEKPTWIKTWERLPMQERHDVIQKYIEWKIKTKGEK